MKITIEFNIKDGVDSLKKLLQIFKTYGIGNVKVYNEIPTKPSTKKQNSKQPKHEYVEKVCVKCHNIFKAPTWRQRICFDCRPKKKEPAIVNCEKCGAEFKKTGNRKFCDECKTVQYVKKPIVVKICAVCGESFETRNSIKKYCDVKCRDLKYKNLNPNTAKINTYKLESKRYCRNCGVEFIFDKPEQLYCRFCKVNGSDKPPTNTDCDSCGLNVKECICVDIDKRADEQAELQIEEMNVAIPMFEPYLRSGRSNLSVRHVKMKGKSVDVSNIKKMIESGDLDKHIKDKGNNDG